MSKTLDECINEARLQCNPVMVNWIDGCRKYLYDELFDSEQEPMNDVQINLLYIQIHYLEELLRSPSEINKFSNKSELYAERFD